MWAPAATISGVSLSAVGRGIRAGGVQQAHRFHVGVPGSQQERRRSKVVELIALAIFHAIHPSSYAFAGIIAKFPGQLPQDDSKRTKAELSLY
jgi:hypothetical protein